VVPFDALLPGWGNPAGVLAVLAAWAAVDAGLVALLVRAGDRRLAAAGATFGLLSALGVALVARGVGGRALSLAAPPARLVVLALAGLAARGSRRRLAGVAVAGLVTLLLGLPVLILLGEATVAP
jgi:hypothetical protein